MKEVVEKCTEVSEDRCYIRLVLQILLKRPTQLKKEDAVAISAYALGLGREKSLGRRNSCV